MSHTLEQLQRLDMEARSFSPEQSRPLIQKVKEYRSDINKLKEDVKRASTAPAIAESRYRSQYGIDELYYGADVYFWHLLHAGPSLVYQTITIKHLLDRESVFYLQPND